MRKLTGAVFAGLLVLSLVGCDDPGQPDDVMEDQQQDRQDQGGSMGEGSNGGAYGDDQDDQGDQGW